MDKRNATLAALPLALLIFAGCSRPQNENTSVRLDLPALSVSGSQKISESVSAQSLSLKHVLVNVSGSDFTTLVLIYSPDDGATSGCTGSSCMLEVPSGNNRLIQVLAVYEDSVTDGMDFSYGDSTVNLAGGDVGVAINVSSLSAGATTKESRISGRYLTSASDGPSGKISVSLVPNGRPPMQFGTTEIHRGWFSVFAMTGIKFDYQINGVSMFGGPKSADEISNPTLASQVQVNWPAHYVSKNGAATIEKSAMALYGFFGSSNFLSNTKVCYLAGANGPIFGKWMNQSMSNSLMYGYSDATGDLTNVTTSGSRAAGANNACTGATSASNAYSVYAATNAMEMFVDPTTGNFKTTAPFKSAQVTSGVLSVSLLPGISTTDVTGIKAFLVNKSALSSFQMTGPMDQMNCNLMNSKAGVAGSGVVTAGLSCGAAAHTTVGNPMIVTSIATLNGDPVLILCARKSATEFYLNALEVHN